MANMIFKYNCTIRILKLYSRIGSCRNVWKDDNQLTKCLVSMTDETDFQ